MAVEQPLVRRRADAERTIDAVLTAASHLLAAGADPSMVEIASAAGVGRVTLYGHFSSREDLLTAMVSRAVAETDQALNGLQLDALSPWDALEQLIRASWPILDGVRAVRAVALARLSADALHDVHDPVMKQVESIVLRGQRDGSFRSDLPVAWAVSAFFALMHAAADEATRGILRPEDAADLLVRTIGGLLRP